MLDMWTLRQKDINSPKVIPTQSGQAGIETLWLPSCCAGLLRGHLLARELLDSSHSQEQDV